MAVLSGERTQFEFRQDDNLTPSATVTPRFAHTKRGFATVRLPHAGTRPRGPARLPSVRSTCSQGSIELGGRVAVIADRPSLYPPHSRRHNRSDRHFLFPMIQPITNTVSYACQYEYRSTEHGRGVVLRNIYFLTT